MNELESNRVRGYRKEASKCINRGVAAFAGAIVFGLMTKIEGQSSTDEHISGGLVVACGVLAVYSLARVVWLHRQISIENSPPQNEQPPLV